MCTTNITTINVQYYVGGLFTINETSISGGSIVRLGFTLQGTRNDTITDIGIAFATVFEEYWEEHYNDYSDSNIIIHYNTFESFTNEGLRVVQVDIPLFGMAFVIMLLYLSFALSKFDCIRARPIVALASLLSTITALVIGFGIGCTIGYSTNGLVFLTPFILLGIGVDDDIIIVESLDDTPLPNDKKRFGLALQHSCTSITLTSFSSIAAFAVGSNADMPGVAAFCMFSSFAFLANYGMFV